MRVSFLVILTSVFVVVSGGAAQAELPAGGTFIDDDGNLHEGNIEAIAAEGITLGCGPELYCPANPVTRAEMAAFLLRALSRHLGQDHDSAAHLPAYQGYFSDVSAGQWYTGYVEHLREHGITLGCNAEGTLYCWNEPVTREQMASFLVRTFGFPASQTDYFRDDDLSLHQADINAIREAGVTLGCSPDGQLYCPKDLVLRDQMASFLARVLSLQPIVPPPVITFGEGTWRVGIDIPAGTYRSTDSSGLCYWERLRGFSGSFDEIIANDAVDYRTVVTILASDVGFSSERCGSWSNRLTRITSDPGASFGDGLYIVGVDISSGTWRSEVPASYCYWERLAGFSGSFDEILANDLTSSQAIVQIAASDIGFRAEGCGAWSRIGD